MIEILNADVRAHVGFKNRALVMHLLKAEELEGRQRLLPLSDEISLMRYSAGIDDHFRAAYLIDKDVPEYR